MQQSVRVIRSDVRRACSALLYQIHAWRHGSRWWVGFDVNWCVFFARFDLFQRELSFWREKGFSVVDARMLDLPHNETAWKTQVQLLEHATFSELET